MVGPFLASPSTATLRVVDHDIDGRPVPADIARLSVPLTSVVTAEVDETGRTMGLPAEAILLAALGGAIARVIGVGVVAVDLSTDNPALLRCVSTQDISATEILAEVQRTLSAGPRPGAGQPADVLFSCVGAAPFDVDGVVPGHALQLRVYRNDALLHLDWWYDTRRLDQGTVGELAEHFPLALIELTSEASPPMARAFAG
jgi:hypothetical protein